MTEVFKNSVIYMGQQRQNEQLKTLLQDTGVETVKSRNNDLSIFFTSSIASPRFVTP
jgi:hypothetical protein